MVSLNAIKTKMAQHVNKKIEITTDLIYTYLKGNLDEICEKNDFYIDNLKKQP